MRLEEIRQDLCHLITTGDLTSSGGEEDWGFFCPWVCILGVLKTANDPCLREANG